MQFLSTVHSQWALHDDGWHSFPPSPLLCTHTPSPTLLLPKEPGENLRSERGVDPPWAVSHLSCHQAVRKACGDTVGWGEHRNFSTPDSPRKHRCHGPTEFRRPPPALSFPPVQRSHLRRHLTVNEHAVSLPMHLDYKSTLPRATMGYSHFLNSSGSEEDDGITLLKISRAQGHALVI